MKRKLMKFSGISALALTLVMWGCDNLSDPSSRLTGPADQSNILIVGQTKGGYTIARETDPSVGVVTALIDQNGGALSIGRILLTVPAGAVAGPTTFTMTKLVGDIKVGLTATKLLPNDVGHAGFAKPVTLRFGYDRSENVNADNEGKLRVMWLKPDGTEEVQPTVVQPNGRVVTGYLNHFTDFGLGWP